MSSEIRLYSWNVNGIRAVFKKGFVDWVNEAQPDILAIQESKISEDKLTPELTEIDGYESYWAHAEKPGYSGVAVYTKLPAKSVNRKLGVKKFDSEGRVLEIDYGKFILFNIYFPNGKMNEERLKYKMDFYKKFLRYANKLRDKKKKLIICGDINTAHNEIDLARPKQNEDVSGFLPIERKWMDNLVDAGYLDTFRHLHTEPDRYSWWSFRAGARQRNVGWRIDYFFTSKNLTKSIVDAEIHDQVTGSDHCPISLTVKL